MELKRIWSNLSISHTTEFLLASCAAIFSMKNFTDPFRVLKGFHEANQLIKALKPDVIFSKGGFVSVPVVMAGKRNHVPTIIHESDITPGLANKLSMPSATKICCNFPELWKIFRLTKRFSQVLQSARSFWPATGKWQRSSAILLPISPSSLWLAEVLGLLRSIRLCGIFFRNFLESFQIIHLCGKGKLDESLINIEATPSLNISKKS